MNRTQFCKHSRSRVKAVKSENFFVSYSLEFIKELFRFMGIYNRSYVRIYTERLALHINPNLLKKMIVHFRFFLLFFALVNLVLPAPGGKRVPKVYPNKDDLFILNRPCHIEKVNT